MHTAIAAPLILLFAVPVGEGPDFATQLAEAELTYSLVSSANTARLLEGDLAGATRALTEAVPEAERSAAHALVAADRLVPLDHERSLALHEEAYAKDPQAPAVVRAWALAQHRAGRFAEAEALYVELLALEPSAEDLARFNALRADCLLHLDRPEEACTAWRAAGAATHQTEVEQAAFAVYGPLGPEARRCALLQRVRAAGDDRDAAADLLLLDLSWDRDPWNVEVNPEAFAHDLPLVKAAYGEAFDRSALAFVSRWTTPGRRFEFDEQIPKLQPPADNREAIRAEAEARGWVGRGSKPPEGRLLSAVDQILIDNEAVTPEELLAWHEPELRRRSQRDDGADDLRALAGLYELTWDDELDALQRMGWRKHGDLECALGLLEREGDALRARDLTLLQALADHPDDVRLNRLRVEAAAREGDVLVEPLSRLIRAQFKRMENCQGVINDFRRLEAALRDRK
jgi:tetratricopeptide (TPR) repeat protein